MKRIYLVILLFVIAYGEKLYSQTISDGESYFSSLIYRNIDLKSNYHSAIEYEYLLENGKVVDSTILNCFYYTNEGWLYKMIEAHNSENTYNEKSKWKHFRGYNLCEFEIDTISKSVTEKQSAVLNISRATDLKTPEHFKKNDRRVKKTQKCKHLALFKVAGYKYSSNYIYNYVELYEGKQSGDSLTSQIKDSMEVKQESFEDRKKMMNIKESYLGDTLVIEYSVHNGFFWRDRYIDSDIIESEMLINSSLFVNEKIDWNKVGDYNYYSSTTYSYKGDSFVETKLFEKGKLVELRRKYCMNVIP